jgi:hypothetical protein
MPVPYDGKRIIRPGTQHDWTPEMKRELKASKKDLMHFALNHVKVQTVDKGVSTLEFRPYQERMFKSMLSENRMICLSPRQTGKTTTAGIYALWRALFTNKKMNIYILSNKGESAKDFLNRIKEVYSDLDPYLKRAIIEWNKTSIVFENGTAIHTSTTTPDSIRGRSVSLLILDEFAHVRPEVADPFWTSAQPTVASGSAQICIISTPNGNTGQFAELWKGAELGAKDPLKGNGFTPFRIEWDEPPGRGEEFRRKMIAETSLMTWQQEYNCSFLGSSSTLINGEMLGKLADMVCDPVKEFPNFEVWEQPQPNRIYLLGCDVAMGVGRDYSVIQVVDITDPNRFKQVAVFADDYIRTPDFTRKINEIGKLYNYAFVIVENNTYGAQICRDLWNDYEYEWLYFEKGKKEKGINANRKTKVNSNASLKRYAEEGKLAVYDKKTIKEMEGYIQLGEDKYGCEEGENSHDDRVDALRWATYFAVSDYWRDLEEFIRDERGIQVSEYEFEDMGIGDETFQPIIFKDDANEDPYVDEDGLMWG